MVTFANRARMSTATTGAGTITLGSATSGYGTFAEAGVSNGDEVSYCIEDGSSFEVGRGVYSSAGPTLSRSTILLSKIAGQPADILPISLSGSATVFLTFAAEDIERLQTARPYLSVQDYGALGNGTTNDAAAFQAALNAAEASTTIKYVYVPHTASGYALGATVTLPPGVVLFGDNRWGLELSRVKPTAGFSSPLFESKSFASARQLRIGVEGLFLDGSSTTLIAIRLRCQESYIRDCTIKNCFTYGIYIGGIGSGPTQQALNNHITDNYLAGIISTTEFFDGIFIDYNSADNTLERNYIEASKDAGIRSRGYNNKITNNHIYAVSGTGGGVGAGIYTETSADHDISQNYIELIAAEGVLIQGGGSDVATLAAAVHGNVFRNIDTGNTSNGVIELSGGDVSSLSISGNVVRRDAATSYATPYFVYFNGIVPTLGRVYGNSWQSGLIATGETNVALPAINDSEVTTARIADDAVTNAKLANMAQATIKGRAVGAGTGDPTDLTGTQATAILDTFTSALKGLAPASGGGTANFLRADGTWAAAGGMVLLTSGTVSSAATLDIVLTSYTAYRAIKFVLESFIPATDDVELWVRVSTNGGSSYDATGYSRVGVFQRDGNATPTAPFGYTSSSDTKIVIAGSTTAGESVSNVAAESGAHCEVTLYDQTVSQWPRICASAVWFGGTVTDTLFGDFAGSRETSQDTDAVRFLFETGNITSGKYAVYGLA